METEDIADFRLPICKEVIELLTSRTLSDIKEIGNRQSKIGNDN